jgi:hypothetical protein
MVSAEGFARRAVELERAADAAESHDVAINDAQAELLAKVIRLTFDAIDLPVTGSLADLVRDLLIQAAEKGGDLDPGATLVAAAREQVFSQMAIRFDDGLQRAVSGERVEP